MHFWELQNVFSLGNLKQAIPPQRLLWADMGRDNCKRLWDNLKLTKEREGSVGAAGTSVSLLSSGIHITGSTHELNVIFKKKEKSGCFLDFWTKLLDSWWWKRLKNEQNVNRVMDSILEIPLSSKTLKLYYIMTEHFRPE